MGREEATPVAKRFECGGITVRARWMERVIDAMRLQSKPFDYPTDNAAIPLRRSKRCSADEPAFDFVYEKPLYNKLEREDATFVRDHLCASFEFQKRHTLCRKS